MDISGYEGTTLHVVIRRSFIDCSGVYTWLQTRSAHILVGQHAPHDTDDGIHCHFAVLKPTVTVEGLRKNIKSHSWYEGKETYSILLKAEKSREDLKFVPLCRYIIKGDRNHLKDTTVPGPHVDLMQADWRPVASKVVYDASGGRFVNAGVKSHDADSKFSIVQEIVAKVGDEYLENERLAELVREALIKRDMVLGMYKVLDLCDAVRMYSKSNKHKWIASIVSVLDKRY